MRAVSWLLSVTWSMSIAGESGPGEAGDCTGTGSVVSIAGSGLHSPIGSKYNCQLIEYPFF